MKKFLTLVNVLKCAAVLLGLIAFFLMFAKQLYVGDSDYKAFVAFDDALFGEGGSVISFIGYLLIILAAIAVCVLLFVKLDKKIKLYVALGLAFVFVLAAIFVFIEASVVNNNALFAYHLTAAPVFAGILAILSAILLVASEFVKDKQLL